MPMSVYINPNFCLALLTGRSGEYKIRITKEIADALYKDQCPTQYHNMIPLDDWIVMWDESRTFPNPTQALKDYMEDYIELLQSD